MARKTTTATNPIEKFGIDASMNGFRAGTNVYRALFDGIGACNAEATRFVGQRLAKDFDVPSELAHCQTPTDVLELQSLYVQTLISDYAEEAKRMSSLTTEALAKGMDPEATERG